MRVSPTHLVLVGSLVLGGAVLAQQTPPPAGAAADGRQGGRGGRGNTIQIKPGEECPPGTTMTRPGECQAPGFPPPSIVDYRPRTTLVTAAHLVPKAKFP